MGTIDIHRFNEVRLIMVVMLPVSVAPSKATARRHGMRKDFSMRPAAAGGEQQTYAKTPVFQKKQQLLDAVAPLNRGAEASETDKARIENLAAQLCKENPTAKPFESELINRKWRLLYTTSASLLGLSRPGLLRPKAIYQTLDSLNLKARNEEESLLGFSVAAELTPVSDTQVKVQFKQFSVGWLTFPAPDSAKGELNIKYLDSDLLISEGNKGNLFIQTA